MPRPSGPACGQFKDKEAAMPDTIERIRPTGADAAPSTIEGRIDKVEGGRLYGWAWDRLRPADRLEVTAFLGERRLGTALANRVRDDLRLNGIGDGLYAFEIEIGDDADGASGGAVPGGIQVQARSPATGAAELLERHAPEPEVRADVLLTPLSRILAGVDRLAAAQRQIHGIQQ